MLAIALIVFVLAEPAIRLFIDEPDAVEFGTRYLRIIAFLYPFLGINFILNGIVRAAGAMYSVLVLNLISFWVLRYPLTFLFSSIYGSDGIALGMGLSLVISSLVAYRISVTANGTKSNCLKLTVLRRKSKKRMMRVPKMRLSNRRRL